MLTRLLAYALCAFVVMTQLPLVAQPFTPTAAYKRDVIQGFTVLTSPEVVKHPKEAAIAQQELAAQLQQIQSVLPPSALEAMRKVRIWMEWNAHKTQGATFHPSVHWLRSNGYNPEKVNSVEISNIRRFVQWSRQEQPWMLLHELSHAYHFRVLGGESYGRIKAAYGDAIASHRYDAVEDVRGRQTRAYAMTNEKEYFAELSEAYFGQNDFYPFNRQQLEELDPEGFQLMQQAWGSN